MFINAFTFIIMRRIALFIITLVSMLPTMAQTRLTESLVYQRLISRQTQSGYTEGTPWTNADKYVNTVTVFGYGPGCFTGGGCFGFMMDMMEFASNYEYNIEKIEASYNDLPKIHVGDGIRVLNNAHSVVVLEVAGDGHTVTVCEANYNYSVHWGRVIDLSSSSSGVTYIASFWPNVPTDIDDNDMAAGTRDVTILSLSGVTMVSARNTGKLVHELLGGLPKGYYVVKEGSKTYKVFNKGE